MKCKRVSIVTNKMDSVAKMNDLHVPYHDMKAIVLAINLLKQIKPTKLIIDEVIDMYQVSKYNKDPNRKLTLQDDIDMSVHILDLIRSALPKTQIIMVESNHDKRLTKFLSSRAEELYNLKALQFESLLQLRKFDIEYYQSYMFRGVLFKHGNVVRKDSSYTAKAEFMKEGCSGCSGHTHRLGTYYITLRGGKYLWLECGCLCKINNIEYIEGTANWQQGLGIFTFPKNKRRFFAQTIPIIDHKVIWGDKVLEV